MLTNNCLDFWFLTILFNFYFYFYEENIIRHIISLRLILVSLFFKDIGGINKFNTKYI